MLQQGMYDEKELNHIESSLNKDSGGCTSNTAGTAYLFEIDHLKPTHLKFEKLEGQDARRLEPHQCKNHCIDNSWRTFSDSVPTKKIRYLIHSSTLPRK